MWGGVLGMVWSIGGGVLESRMGWGVGVGWVLGWGGCWFDVWLLGYCHDGPCTPAWGIVLL